jgi:hypothetical protein
MNVLSSKNLIVSRKSELRKVQRERERVNGEIGGVGAIK